MIAEAPSNVVHLHEITPAQKPLDRMLAAFPDAYQDSKSDSPWWHHDDNPRFDFRVRDDDSISLHSWTGADAESILARGRVPLKLYHLYPQGSRNAASYGHTRVEHIDLYSLAEHLWLDPRFLLNIGYNDEYRYTSKKGITQTCVKVGGYCTPDGKEHSKHQVRLSLNKEPRFLWNQHTPGEIIPSGLHGIARARAEFGYEIIGEGASDYATMAFHDLPFIGIPGASMSKKLDVSLLEGIPLVYILEEPDQVQKSRSSGKGFYAEMHDHLRSGGYDGQIYALPFMEATGYKDPSDLHKAICRTCQQEKQSPFWPEVRARYQQVIAEALSNKVIPAGDNDDEPTDALFPELPSRHWSDMPFEEFAPQVMAVPGDYLTHRQKLILLYLFLYVRRVEPDDELGWQLDYVDMAHSVGMKPGPCGVRSVQQDITYLYESMGILQKQRRSQKEYVNAEGKDERAVYKGTSIYVRPRASFYAPRGYCVVTADQHQAGGPRLTSQVCDLCGSTHLRPYAKQCMTCTHVMYPPIEADEMGAREHALSLVVVPSVAITQEALPNVAHLEEEEDTPECTILVHSHIENNTTHQNGTFGVSPFSDERLAQIEPLLRQQSSLFWTNHDNAMPVGIITADKYLRRLLTCLDSGDSRQIKAAQDDIERRCAGRKG